MHNLGIAFAAGDREIAVQVLHFIVSQGIKPHTLLLAENSEVFGNELINLCQLEHPGKIIRGENFRSNGGLDVLKSSPIDYLICIHFPYRLPEEVLKIPRLGALNLHPSFLPYNRGWHTPSWAIFDGTPFGATLHFMDNHLDTGDIIHQQRMAVLKSDTADTLYKRVLKLELEVFQEAWPMLLDGTFTRKVQCPLSGTAHKKKELLSLQKQRINLSEKVRAGDLITKLRALTTNSIGESAYFEEDGRRFRIRVQIIEDKVNDQSRHDI